MSTQELCAVARDLKELRLMAELLDAEIAELEQTMSLAFIQMSAVFAELELSIIRARVRSGMQNAKAKGRKIGRPRLQKEDIPATFLRHYAAYQEGRLNISELARVCGLSRPTVYKYLKVLG